MDSIIHVKDLWFTFPEAQDALLKGVNLEIQKGSSLAVVGLSGSGKTTFAHCLCGIYPLIKKGKMAGRVMIKGKDISEYRISGISREIGIVFQNPDTQLFLPTVEDEIAFGLENLCWEPDRILERIDEVCRRVGIEKFRLKNPKELSGGEKQLVAIGAILSLDPDILIFDEAMSQLDDRGTAMVKAIIKDLKQQGKTIVMIEHNPEHFHLADEVKLLRNGCLVEYEGLM